MSRKELEVALAAAIDAESAVGIPWGAGREMAPIAVRRWSTFARRNKAKRPTDQQRVLDLAKGLQAHYEPDVLYTPPNEWLHLAGILAGVFQKFDEQEDHTA